MKISQHNGYYVVELLLRSGRAIRINISSDKPEVFILSLESPAYP